MKCKPTSAAARQAGFTLVEGLIVMAIAAVAVGAAAPGFDAARQRRHLDGAAAQLETDVHFVRSLAVAHNRGLRIGFAAGDAGSCYVVHTGATDACTCSADGSAACVGAEQAYRVVGFEAASPVQARSNVRSILFDPDQGTSTPTGTVRFIGRSGAAIHAVISLMGRVRHCASAPGLAGLPDC